MLSRIERIKRLKVIANILGSGWFFHELLTENSNRYFLSNRKGLYIIVGTKYGMKIEQWKLCINDTSYVDYYPSVCSIGCSLEKSDSSIVSDIKNRLLSSESIAYEKMKTLAIEKGNKALLKENRTHVINSLKNVFAMEVAPHQRGNCYQIKDSDELSIADVEHIHDRVDRFNLNLRGISSKDIILIMGLLSN